MSRIVNPDVDVTLITFSKGEGAFVFVGDEFAGSVERDSIGWTGNAVLGTEALHDGSMWGLVQKVYRAHAIGSLALMFS